MGRAEREQPDELFQIRDFFGNTYNLVNIQVSIEKGWSSKDLFCLLLLGQNATQPRLLEGQGRDRHGTLTGS